MIHTVKDFRVVNEREACFLAFPLLFYNPADVGDLIYGSFAFSEASLYIWKFSVHILLKPILRILSIVFLVCEISAIL